MAVHGTQSWVVSKISPHRNRLREVPEAALAKYHTISADLRLPWNSRTTANVLNSYLIDEAKRAFTGISQSQFIEANNTTYHVLGDCALWYKQLGDDGLPSNFPTDTVVDLMQGAFPFASKKFLLVVGVELDPLVQVIKRVEIQRYSDIGKMQYYVALERPQTRARIIGITPRIEQAKLRSRVTIRRGPEQTEIASGEK